MHPPPPPKKVITFARYKQFENWHPDRKATKTGLLYTDAYEQNKIDFWLTSQRLIFINNHGQIHSFMIIMSLLKNLLITKDYNVDRHKQSSLLHVIKINYSV